MPHISQPMRAIRERLLDAQHDADVFDASASDAAVQQHVVERRGRFDDENDEEPLRNGRRVRGKRAAQIAVCSSSVTRMVPRVEPRHFDSWTQFNQVWCEYLAANFLCYRTRSSHSTPRWNEKAKKAYKVPESFEWAEKTMWCTHGCIQESRGTGKRKRGQIRFTGCPARVHFMVTPRNVDGVVQWKIRCVREIVVHNHYLSEDIFASYMSNSVVTDEQLFGPSENAQQDGIVVHPVEDTVRSVVEDPVFQELRTPLVGSTTPLVGSTTLSANTISDVEYLSQETRRIVQTAADRTCYTVQSSFDPRGVDLALTEEHAQSHREQARRDTQRIVNEAMEAVYSALERSTPDQFRARVSQLRLTLNVLLAHWMCGDSEFREQPAHGPRAERSRRQEAT